MTAEISQGYRFYECCACLEDANTINGGQDFRAIGHLTEQAGCIHAVCLPCIQREDESRAYGSVPRNQSTFVTCPICRSPLIDGEPDEAENRARAQRVIIKNYPLRPILDPLPPIMQRKEFTVRPVAVMNENGQSAFIGEVTLITATLPERINNIRERSKIEIVFEIIARELIGRVVSLVVGVVVGGLSGMLLWGVVMGVLGATNEADPGFFDSQDGGLSVWQASIILGGVIGAGSLGIEYLIKNPYGNTMGRYGAQVGKTIVSGLEGLNDLIERTNRAWGNMFVNVAGQLV